MNNDFTICLGRKNEITYHDAHKEQDFHVTLADTGTDAMTGDRVRAAGKYINDDTFMVTYGDGVSDVNVNALIDFHRSHGKLATVTTVRPISRFGVLEMDPLDKVMHFIEKPQLDGWASAGFFVFQREVLDYLKGDDCILEQEPLEQLVREGELLAYRHEGFFFAMDTYREYKYLNDLWIKGEAQWKVWE
jgi:glucose-1-phosphate cytidylyltransferase